MSYVFGIPHSNCEYYSPPATGPYHRDGDPEPDRKWNILSHRLGPEHPNSTWRHSSVALRREARRTHLLMTFQRLCYTIVSEGLRVEDALLDLFKAMAESARL